MPVATYRFSNSANTSRHLSTGIDRRKPQQDSLKCATATLQEALISNHENRRRGRTDSQLAIAGRVPVARGATTDFRQRRRQCSNNNNSGSGRDDHSAEYSCCGTSKRLQASRAYG